MNEEDGEATPAQPRPYESKPLRLSSSPPMWNDRARGVGGGGGSSLAPKAPYYISGAILLVAIVIVAFAFFGKGDNKTKQPTIVAQPTAVAQPDGQAAVPGAPGAPAAPAGPAGNPLEAVSAAVQRLVAKPLIEDCTKA